MSYTWNIFLCGSKHNENDTDNLITKLWEGTEPTGRSKHVNLYDPTSKFIIPGPGSMGTYGHQDKPFSGSYRSSTLREKLTSTFLPGIEFVGVLRGLFIADRYMKNVVSDVLGTIERLRKGSNSEELVPKRINLVGWSRGATIALTLAESIGRSVPKIETNVFAIDPVPGPVMHLTKIGGDVSGVVNAVEQIIMLHDKMPIFRFKMSAVRSRDRVYPLPGVHTSAAEQSDEPLYGPVQKVAAVLAGDFLRKYDANAKCKIGLAESAGDLCNYYAQMIMKKPDLLDRKVVSCRNFSELMLEYQALPRYYINRHHERKLIEHDGALHQFIVAVDKLETYSPAGHIRRALEKLKRVKQQPAYIPGSLGLFLHKKGELANMEEALEGFQATTRQVDTILRAFRFGWAHSPKRDTSIKARVLKHLFGKTRRLGP